ncbi:MAG: HAAS signaling domain-containing protein [Promethearchaeota archaeon]
MNQNKYKLEIAVQEFLKAVENKLPGWLKDDKFEKREVLNELEEHIWDKADGLASGEEINIGHIHTAISSMGDPDHIGKEYKKRGTPHVYISKEWWELYKKVMLIALFAMIGINLIVFIVQLFTDPFWDNVGSMLSGLWGSILPLLAVITVIFVLLSMEGFLPKDFADEFEKARMSNSNDCEVEVSFMKTKFSGKFKASKSKPPIKIKGLLSDGISGIIWAFLMIAQPIESLNVKFTPEFLEFIRLMGILGLAESIIKILQVFSGVQRVGTQQILIIALIVINILYIQRYLWAIDIESVLRMWTYWSFDPSTIFKIILWISVVGTGISSLEKLGEIGTYPNKLRRYNEFQEVSRAEV